MSLGLDYKPTNSGPSSPAVIAAPINQTNEASEKTVIVEKRVEKQSASAPNTVKANQCSTQKSEPKTNSNIVNKNEENPQPQNSMVSHNVESVNSSKTDTESSPCPHSGLRIKSRPKRNKKPFADFARPIDSIKNTDNSGGGVQEYPIDRPKIEKLVISLTKLEQSTGNKPQPSITTKQPQTVGDEIRTTDQVRHEVAQQIVIQGIDPHKTYVKAGLKHQSDQKKQAKSTGQTLSDPRLKVVAPTMSTPSRGFMNVPGVVTTPADTIKKSSVVQFGGSSVFTTPLRTEGSKSVSQQSQASSNKLPPPQTAAQAVIEAQKIQRSKEMHSEQLSGLPSSTESVIRAAQYSPSNAANSGSSSNREKPIVSTKPTQEKSIPVIDLSHDTNAATKMATTIPTKAADTTGSSAVALPNKYIDNGVKRSPLHDRYTPPFSWELYFKHIDAKPAPVQAFAQETEPLVNKFLPGMMLSARDPRNTSLWCLATVINLVGPRLRLRLEGGDTLNDIGELINSPNIRPIRDDTELEPPMGYKGDVTTYPRFVRKKITRPDAQIAPPELFLRAPQRPKKNLFEVNMKLEAKDRKNSLLICPATIGEVIGDDVKILFDGWKSYDYVCRYYDRDLFPINWCVKNGYPIENPKGWENLVAGKSSVLSSPPKTPKPASTAQAKTSVKPNSAKSIEPRTKLIEPRQPTTYETTTPKRRGRPPKWLKAASSPGPSVITFDKASDRTKQEKPRSQCARKSASVHPKPAKLPRDLSQAELDRHKVSVPIKQAAYRRKYNIPKDTPLSDSQKWYASREFHEGELDSYVMESESSQECSESVMDDEVQFLEERPGSNDLKSSSSDDDGSSTEEDLPVDRFQCQRTIPWLGGSKNKLANDAAADGACSVIARIDLSALERINRKSGDKCKAMETETTPANDQDKITSSQQPSIDSNTHSEPSPKKIKLTESTQEVSQISSQQVVLKTSESIPNQSSPDSNALCVSSQLSTNASVIIASPTTSALPTDYLVWTTNDVTNLIASDPSLEKYSELFRNEEIDGKAFMKLTMDIMSKHMMIKLGPALKIMDMIEQAKRNKK